VNATSTQVDIGGWLNRTWELFKSNLGLWVVINLIAGLLGILTLGILLGPLMVGVCGVILKRMDGQPAQVGDVFQGLNYFVPGLIYAIAWVGLTFLLVFLLQFTCVLSPLSTLVPAAVGAAVAFAPFLIWEQHMDGIRALRTSYAMAKPVFLMLAVYVLVLQILSGLGVLACGIGAVVTAPLLPIGLAVAYRQMNAPTSTWASAETPQPPPVT